MVKKPYLGRGLAYPLRLGADGDFAKNIDNVEAVRDAVTFLLHTLRGERPFRPNTGSKLPNFKHEPNSPETREALNSEIFNALVNGEPRIQDVQTSVEAAPGNDRYLLVKISYTVIPGNVPQNLVFPFYLSF